MGRRAALKGGQAAGLLIIARLGEDGSTEKEDWSCGGELLSL